MIEAKQAPEPTPPLRRSVIDQLIAASLHWRTKLKHLFYKLTNLEKANMELAIKQLRRGEYFDAGMRFKFVIFLNKNNTIAHYLLGKTYFYRGKLKEAIAPLRRALVLKPDLEEAKFLLACCGSVPNITAVPPSFIIERQDTFSARYEEFAIALSPLNKALAEDLKKALGEKMAFNVLDLGGRGGDSAQSLRGGANSIIGVEPSLKMSAIAKSRRVNDLLTYNLVVTKFPEDYLKNCKEKFAVVLSTYYLNFFGPLEDFFKAVKNVLEPGGFFAFNIRKYEGGGDYVFRPASMGFVHSPAYIEKLASANKFNVLSAREVKYPDGKNELVYILERK